MSTTEGFPSKKKKKKRRRVNKNIIERGPGGLTDQRNRERQFTLVSTRQLARQPVRIHVQRGRNHERLDVGVQFGSTLESLETSVDQQVFPDGQLGVDGGELGADAERETCVARRVDDGDALNLDIPCVGNDIASFNVHELSVERTERTDETRTNHVERRRLARPVWPQHSEYDIPRNPKGDIVHHSVPIKRLGDVNNA